ncbi:alrB, partial [Symbiodinium microadriaticum]
MDPMRASIEKSQLDLYGTRRKLDVAILHASFCWRGHCTPEQEAYGWKNAWKNLEELHREGLISAIGVSNFGEEDLLDLLQRANARVSVVQNWMDPFRQDVRVRDICKEYGIVYMAYSSMGGQWQHIIDYNPVLDDPILVSIADKHHCSVASVVYSWVLHEDAVVLPRSTDASHIMHDAGLLSEHRVYLDDEDMQRIRSLDGQHGRH